MKVQGVVIFLFGITVFRTAVQEFVSCTLNYCALGDTFFFFFFFMINSGFFFSSFSCPPLIIEIIYNNISS